MEVATVIVQTLLLPVMLYQLKNGKMCHTWTGLLPYIFAETPLYDVELVVEFLRVSNMLRTDKG